MADNASTCVNVTTQADLDAALELRKKNPAVCIHATTNAEDSVLQWQDANRAEIKIEGDW